MKKLCFALLVAIALPTIGLAQAAPAATPNASKYLPVSEIKPGMKGYGMTCFQGSTPERFDVEILGVLDGQPNPKQSIILGRLSGANVDRTRVFAGMSGSPVYV